jgi:hypothetical protein
MKAVLERTHANIRKIKAEMRVNNEKFQVLQGQLNSTQEMKAKMDCHHEKLMAIMKAGQEK